MFFPSSDASALASPTSDSNGSNTAAAKSEEGGQETQVNSAQSPTPGSSLKSNGHGSNNGKGHKVHFREDSFGGSSGYGSMSSKDGGARPKVVELLQ